MAAASHNIQPELVATIDGNVAHNAAPHAVGGSGVAAVGACPAVVGGVGGRIKINISKPLPVIAPKENKDLSSVDVDHTNNSGKGDQSVDPSQPLPPGEEPVQLKLKPALQGTKLKKLPPVHKDSELTGLCSIM